MQEDLLERIREMSAWACKTDNIDMILLIAAAICCVGPFLDDESWSDSYDSDESLPSESNGDSYPSALSQRAWAELEKVPRVHLNKQAYWDILASFEKCRCRGCAHSLSYQTEYSP